MKSTITRSDTKRFAKCGCGKSYYWCRFYCPSRKTGVCNWINKRPDTSLRNNIDNPIHKEGVINKILNNKNYKKSRKEISIKMTENNPMKNPKSVKKMLKNRRSYKGSNGPNWKGGITPINKRIRYSDEFKKWRRDVFNRDNFTCQECGLKGVYLHAHHIKPFSLFPKLRFDIDNGQTLCKKCHAKKPKGRELC